MIRITSKTHGFRRCGLAHTGTVEHPDSRFTRKELAILQADPELVVEIIEGGTGSDKKGTLAVNVTLAAELIQAAETVEALEELTINDSRKGVTDAKAKRLAELTKPE